MIVKKYQGNTEIEAFQLAKDDLGKDAIVLNIKTISPKGIYKLFRKPTVEITAAIDDNNSNNLAGVSENSIRSVGVNPTHYDLSKEEKTSAIELKLNNLQSLLEKQLMEQKKEEEVEEESIRQQSSQTSIQKQDENRLPMIQLVYNQLLRNEVDEKYINQILNEIDGQFKKDTTLDYLLASVYQKIVLKLGQPKTIELIEGTTKFIYFIGPTGVGKTTTIAKIASNLKLQKKAKVALLTSDTYRIAAVEQLKIYANILDIPMKVIYTEEDIKAAREEFSEYDVVLIDTAGRSHKSEEQKDNISSLVGAIEEELREIYLVLSATTKYKDLIQITERYNEITEYRLIFTKLDETCCVGNIFNLRMLTGADLSYTTCGQNVPDDISRIQPQETAKKLLGGQE